MSFVSLRLPVLALLVLLIALTACEGDPAPVPTDSGSPDVAGSDTTAAPDAGGTDTIGADTLSSDASADTAPDVGADAGPDAVADAASDAVSDVGADAGAETTPDVAPDVAPDAESDVGLDGTADAAEDGSVQVDAMPDAVPDAAPDAVSDAVPDGVSDAVPDGVSDAGPDGVSDAGQDTAPDTAPDAAPDTAPDVATDGSADTGGAAPLPTQLAVGQYHQCVVLQGGGVACWGSGGAATGYMAKSTVFLPVSKLVDVGGPVQQIACGGAHTCVVLATGAVRCWGQNDKGQLGYGTKIAIGDDEVPATAGDVNLGGKAVQVTTGVNHTCALLDTGAVRCWGDNSAGQLGYGHKDTIGDDEAPASAGDVNVGGKVVQVSAGSAQTCALLDTGAVRCWGAGGYGALGYGNKNSIGDNEAPASAGDVDLGAKALHIAAGGATLGIGVIHTCAVLQGGAVRCWGSQTTGQLGLATGKVVIGDTEKPTAVPTIDIGATVQAVSPRAHTCVLTTAGAVRCFGYGESGQLGYGNKLTIGDDEHPATAGDVPVGGKVVAVGSGYGHTCALLETGHVRCWGTGTYLGYDKAPLAVGDDETPASMPALVVYAPQ